MNGQGGQNKPVFELLAPAGSPEIFRAVLAAGADAVYLGGDRFGARAYADNFSSEEILYAIDFAHLHGRKIYLTVNTLLKNKEIQGELCRYLSPFYERGLDAVLVQDLGVFSLIRKEFPELPIHASTQMTVTSAEGAGFLQRLGAERIVLSRELSLQEIRCIHETTGAELEVFVHGALCYSYSGQCLFSSLLGGRSANRGRCAQPCRLPYAVLRKGKAMADSYVLSLKDLCGIRDLEKLHAAGVYSLKIEGRMKQLPYAAGTAAIYRRAIDRWKEAKDAGREWEESEAEALEEELFALGSRCGFTDGYYHRRNGADMLTLEKSAYERQEAGGAEDQAPLRRSVQGHLTLRRGEPAYYEVSSGGVCAHAFGMAVQEAKNKPLRSMEVEERLSKTGGTPYTMERVKVDMEGAVFLPNGALNEIRRKALSALTDELLAGYRRSRQDALPVTNAPADREEPLTGQRKNLSEKQSGGRLIALTEKRSLLPVILAQPVTTVYLDAGAYQRGELSALCEDVRLCREAGKEVGFALPRVFRQETAGWYHMHAGELRELSFDAVLVRSYGELSFALRELPVPIVADHNLYTYNDCAVHAIAALGAARNTVPLELNGGEIAHRDNAGSEMIVYGRYPLMTSAQCVHAGSGCDRRAGLTWLRDRRNMRFPVKNYCADCYSVIFNSLPVMLLPRLEELRAAGVNDFRLEFTVESGEETAQVFSLYRGFAQGTPDEYPGAWNGRFTGGHYRRGVE